MSVDVFVFTYLLVKSSMLEICHELLERSVEIRLVIPRCSTWFQARWCSCLVCPVSLARFDPCPEDVYDVSRVV